MSSGVIILAAGAATRMGKAKMLLPFKQTTILQHIINEVVAVEPTAVYLVTGHYHQAISDNIDQANVQIVFNQYYANGMSSSIQIGLKHLLSDYPNIESIIIIVADQPFLNRDIIHALQALRQKTHKGLVAASYDGIIGTPVLLAIKYVEQLNQLIGDKGARSILQAFPEDLATVDFALGGLDIDNEADYEQFCKILNSVHVN